MCFGGLQTHLAFPSGDFIGRRGQHYFQMITTGNRSALSTTEFFRLLELFTWPSGYGAGEPSAAGFHPCERLGRVGGLLVVPFTPPLPSLSFIAVGSVGVCGLVFDSIACW